MTDPSATRDEATPADDAPTDDVMTRLSPRPDDASTFGESGAAGGEGDAALANSEGEEEASDDDEDADEEEEDEEEEEEDDDDDDDEEPRLKYARLTQHLGAVYRNADATSSFLVAGDKLVGLLGANGVMAY